VFNFRFYIKLRRSIEGPKIRDIPDDGRCGLEMLIEMLIAVDALRGHSTTTPHRIYTF